MSGHLAEFLGGPEVEILGWVLFHSLWINSAVAAALAVALLLLRGRSAVVRYWLGLAALALMLLAPAAVFCYLCHTAETYADTAAVDRLARTLKRAVTSARGAGVGGAAQINLSQAPLPQVMPVRHDVESMLAWLQPLLPWLCAGWLATVFLLMMRQLVGWFWLRHLLSRGTSPVQAGGQRLRRLARRLGVPHVQFRKTRVLAEPAAAGFRPAVVMLPARLFSQLNSKQIDAVVAHELAHVRRNDYLINLLQTAMDTLLLWHPAARWVSARVRQERENCCDDVASDAVGDRVEYARALADAVDRMAQMPPLALPIGGGAFLPRILRLVSQPHERRPYAASGLLVACVAALVLLGAGARLFASTQVLREARSLQHSQPLNQVVYDILELPRGYGFLPALAQAVAARAENDPTGAAMRNLVTALNVSSTPQALADAALPRMNIPGDATEHTTWPEWAYGTFIDHLRLSDAMWKHAWVLRPIDPVASREYARASVLLDLQDSYQFGAARLHFRLLNDPTDNPAGLTDEQLSRIRVQFNLYQSTFSAAVGEIAPLLYDLAVAKPTSPTSDLQRVRDYLSLLEQASVLASHRPEIQWIIAEHAWHARANPLATSDLFAPLSRTVLANVQGYGSDHFARWMRQALTTPPPPTMTAIRVLDFEESGELLKVMN